MILKPVKITAYNKNSKLNFGKYKGYVLGMVYVFDPSYIEWCIKNIIGFCITDLDELVQISVMDEFPSWKYPDPSMIPGLNIFDTFQEFIDNYKLGDEKFTFDRNVFSINQSLLNRLKH